MVLLAKRNLKISFCIASVAAFQIASANPLDYEHACSAASAQQAALPSSKLRRVFGWLVDAHTLDLSSA